MGWTLKPGVSFCVADHQLIFLKLDEDRYVRPGAALNTGAIDWLATGGANDTPPPEALRNSLLERTDGPSPFPAPAMHAPATEALVIPRIAQVGTAPAAAAALIRARLEVVTRPLARILETRERRTAAPRVRAPMNDDASRFGGARAWLPMKRRCLPDSLALFDHLTARGHRPRLLFGVVPEPFAAHCWVQHDGTILNDSLDTISRFTPILVL